VSYEAPRISPVFRGFPRFLGFTVAVTVIVVLKPADGCRIENRGFPAFVWTFSSEARARVSSFFRFSFQALRLV
jgi:hypothetical protein